MRLVEQAQQAVAERLFEGALAVDATVGNGHDTLFLARCVGERGHVHGFDIQQPALAATDARLCEAGLERRVSLYHAGHELLAMRLPPSSHGRLQAVMFNLGYLPGGDKGRTTGISTTLAALQQAAQLLAPGGIISVLAYTGHPGGQEEAEAVRQWAATLSPTAWRVTLTIPESRGPAPQWLQIVREGPRG